MDLLTALILEQPRLGAALLHDAGDMLVLLRLGQVPGMAEFEVLADPLCVHGLRPPSRQDAGDACDAEREPLDMVLIRCLGAGWHRDHHANLSVSLLAA